MRGKQPAITLVTIFVLTSSLLFSSATQFSTPAYGHGLSGDMAKPASIGDRLATVRVDMRPAFLLAEAPQDATIEMKFFDTKTNNPIMHVTYFVTLNKGDKVLMRDWFHAHDGDLFIKVRPTQQPRVVLNAPQDPIMNGYIGSKDAPVLAQGPIFVEGGLYHFAIEIFTIDFDNTILDPPLKFDTYISIGETTTYSVVSGAEQQVSIRTYYDKTQEFSFDEENKLLKFSMPFNWDKQYLTQVPLLHQEVVIPGSFTELVADKYTGLVNDIRLPESAVLLDDTNPNELIVHYMIPSQQLLQLADHVKAMSSGVVSTAEFTLAPGIVDLGMPLASDMGSGQMGSQTMAMSKQGTYHIMLSSNPTVIEPGNPTTLIASFMNARTGAMVDVTYDFVLIKDGQEIVRRSGSTTGSIASEQFTFADSHKGSVLLRFEKIGNTEESAEFTLSVGSQLPETPVDKVGKQLDVSVNMKQTKKLTLIAVKNNEETPIFGVKLKTSDADIKFVKTRGWDRDRIDQNTVSVSTQDKPLLPGRSLVILLLSSNPNSSLEWFVLDENGGQLTNGITQPTIK